MCACRQSCRRPWASGAIYGCTTVAAIVDARRLVIERDLPAHRAFLEREIAAGRCRAFAAGAEVIWQRRERGGAALVREAGKPDRLWIDETLWLIEARNAQTAAGADR